EDVTVLVDPVAGRVTPDDLREDVLRVVGIGQAHRRLLDGCGGAATVPGRAAIAQGESAVSSIARGGSRSALPGTGLRRLHHRGRRTCPDVPCRLRDERVGWDREIIARGSVQARGVVVA